jgi:hypothetical protein
VQTVQSVPPPPVLPSDPDVGVLEASITMASLSMPELTAQVAIFFFSPNHVFDFVVYYETIK